MLKPSNKMLGRCHSKMCEKEEGNGMSLVQKKKNIPNSLSEHPNFKSKVPRLNVVDGKAKIDSDNRLQQKWFEEFKK
jgi:hypothetical protein